MRELCKQAGTQSGGGEREMEEREEREKMGEGGGDTRGGREDVFVQSVDHKQDR